MHAEKSNFTIARMARLLEVSRSGFYAWCARAPSKRAVRAERIEQKVAWFHGESDEVSGSPKILADLRGDGEIISAKTVAKTMRKLGLRGVCPKKWRTTTIIDHADAYPVDTANRVWDTGVLNAVWVGDITYLRTWEGWLYLATVIDAHSRRVIGWAIAEHMRTDLVQDALQMAIILRGELPEQVVFHTDRGTQGGFNWSSQHSVMMEVLSGGSSSAGSGSGGARGHEVPGRAGVAARGPAVVLDRDRQGSVASGGGRRCRRVATGRSALVPQRWRNAAI
jgi:hypothetical protein